MKSNQGFIVKIVIIIIAIIALKYYFHWDLISWINSPNAHKYYDPIWAGVKTFYSWLDNLVRGWVGK